MSLMVWSRMFPGNPEMVAHVRRFVRTVLDGRTDTHLMELLASEAATNAIIHTASGLPGGWFVVHVVVFTDRVRIRVFDLGSKNTPIPNPNPGDDETGRGLMVMQTLAMEWGVDGDSAGRVVWFDLPLPRHQLP